MSGQKSDYSILAIDDSDIIINLIQILLESEGYSFSYAYNATDALDLIKQKNFDLILMDIEMPEKTGVELLEEMKQLDLTKDTKVVMLTGKTDINHINICLGLGASGYILKPFDHESMKVRIWEALQET